MNFFERRLKKLALAAAEMALSKKGNPASTLATSSNDSEQTAIVTDLKHTPQALFEEVSRQNTKYDRAQVSENLKKFTRRQGSQRHTAKELGVPTSTLRDWHKRRELLKANNDPEFIEFFESPVGVAVMHRILAAALFVMHKLSSCGVRYVQEFINLAGFSSLVGDSLGAIHKVSQEMDAAILAYELDEKERLAKEMPEKTISAAADETFMKGSPCLVAIEPVSNYILLESIQEERTGEVWQSCMASATKGLKVKINQLTSDQGGGLLWFAHRALGIHQSPDIFHVQQDISKALRRPVAQRVKRMEEAYAEAEKNCDKVVQALAKAVDGQIQSTKNGYIVPDHALPVAQKYRECQLALEFAKVALQESKVNAEKFNPILKTLGDCYHPVNLDTGTLKTASLFKTELEAIFQTCHEVEIQTPHSDKQKKCMQKARKLQGVLINTINFFERSIMAYEEQLDLQCVPISLKTHSIDEGSSCFLGEELSEKELFRNVLLPICYLQNIVPKARDAEQKIRIQNTMEMVCQRYKGYLLDWIQTPRGQELHGAALECAQVFQRSSSCVEGRNGRLSLMYGNGRGLSESRLKILTILHNFHIKREDGSTAAERFFEKKPEELFNYVLDKISFPVRPRQRMAASA